MNWHQVGSFPSWGRPPVGVLSMRDVLGADDSHER